MKAELQSVNWDSELQKEIEGNISKTLKYISVKIEQQIYLNEDTLRLIGRVSKAQSANYQMLCVAFEFTRYFLILLVKLHMCYYILLINFF